MEMKFKTKPRTVVSRVSCQDLALAQCPGQHAYRGFNTCSLGRARVLHVCVGSVRQAFASKPRIKEVKVDADRFVWLASLAPNCHALLNLAI